MAYFDSSDPEGPDRMRNMFGSGQVDQQVRQAIQMCWLMLPDDRRTLDEVERQVRRIIERAFSDMREDAEQFGLGS
jgi:hypothetical protein